MSLRTRRSVALLGALLFAASACTGTPQASSTAPAASATPPAATSAAPASPSEAPASPSEAPASPSEAPASPSEAPASPSEAPASPTAPPATGGTLVYALDGQMTQLTNANSDVPTAEAVQWIYDALYSYNENLEPVPNLAASEAEISEDGKTWTLKLVDNATFQPGGKKMTADDVVFTYQLSNSKNCRFNPSICLAFVTVTPEGATAAVPVMTKIEKVDDTTVRFTLADKYAPFATVILPGIAIDSKEAVEAAYAKFSEATGQVQATAVANLAKAIAAEQEKPEPATDQFIPQLEQILDQAGVERPQAADFPATDEQGNPVPGQTDNAAYFEALNATFQDVAKSVAAEGIDAIAAAYPLLEISRKPVGTGPFYVAEGGFKSGESLTVTANPDYHKGRPALDQVVMPIITDEIAAVQALGAGRIDWKYSMTADAYNQVKDSPNVKFSEYPDFGYFGLQFNLREGKLFADKRIRQAVAYCTQKEQIVAAATNDQGVPVYADIPPASWAYNPNLPKYEHDPAKGKALIEEAGFTLGGDGVYAKGDQKLATTVLVRAGKPDRIKFMSLLRDQLNQNCGFDMQIKEVDFGTVLVPMLEWPHAQQGKQGSTVIAKQFDAYFGGWGTSLDPDPYSIFHSSQCTTPDLPGAYNYICFKNEKADELIEQGLRELDQDARAQIYQEYQAILADELPYLFAWSDRAREGVNKAVNSTDGEWTPENMGSPTWFWQLEKITKTAQ